jgi:integrase
MRLTEALRLRWDSVDPDNGTVTVEGRTKNAFSVRRIPIPGLVSDVLSESPRTTQRVLSEFSGDDGPASYGKAVRRWMKMWNPDLDVVAADLRDVLQTEAEMRGWDGYVLDRYCGHAANSIRRKHYTKPRKGELVEAMREQVTIRMDEILNPFRQAWNNRGGNVIALRSGTIGQ